MISLIKKSNKLNTNYICIKFTTTSNISNNTNNTNIVSGSSKFINIYRSNLFIPFQNDQKIGSDMLDSQLLMQKGGLIRRLSAGTYSTLPFAQKVMDNIIRIIDEEMEKVGGQKMSMPKLLPRSLWEKTGRWESAGDDLIKLKDRKGEEYCLAPTHEEVVTSIVSNEMLPNSSFPIKLYQIGEKYRDEVRPRFGLLRGREFLMKDMYSFDTSKENAEKTYYQVKQAYHNIMDRLELPYACVEADSGNIGGNMSHEFQVLANVGEDTLIHCTNCNYHANIEKAKGLPSIKDEKNIIKQLKQQESIPKETISNFKKLSLTIMKITTLPLSPDKQQEEIAIIVNRSSDTFNHYSIKPNYNDIQSTCILSPKEYNQYRKKMSIGNPESIDAIKHTLFIDSSVTGLEKPNKRKELIKKLNKILKTSITIDQFNQEPILKEMVIGQNFREAKNGDLCIQDTCNGKSKLSTKKGIEVGHIFYLGTKYSSKLGANYTGPGQAKIPLEMGCFGIGVSRLLATIVETHSNFNNSENDGFSWPSQVAPYQIIIVPKHTKSQLSLAESISQQLQSEIPCLKSRIIIEDRSKVHIAQKVLESKFLGIPYFLVIDNVATTDSNQPFKIEYKSESPEFYSNENELINYFKNKFNN